jgi:Flp pilus assembly protein TadD
LVVSGSAAAALATVVLALPWLAAAEVARAASSWRTDPGAAFRRLETARQLNVLSDMPDLVAGAIASRVGDRPRMVAAFERALARNRRDWYANLELGVAAALDGRRTVALKRLEAARRLDPLEPTIRALTRDIRAGRRISPPELDRVFLARIRA